MKVLSFLNKFNPLIIKLLLLAALFVMGIIPVLNASEAEVVLKDALKLAVKNSTYISRADFEIQKSEILVDKAKAYKKLPKVDLKVTSGLVSDARGDIFDSPDSRDDYDDLGPFIKFNISAVQPVYTFGKIKSGILAAEKSMESLFLKKEMVINKVSQKVIETYCAAILTRKNVKLARQLKDSYEELLKEVQKRLGDKKFQIDHTHLLEVKSSSFQVEQNFLESKNKYKSATQGLNILLGFNKQSPISPALIPVPVFEMTEDVIEKVIPGLVDNHPKMKILTSLIEALEFKIDFTERKNYPVVYLAGGYKYSNANGRDKQDNPFASENWNYSSFGAEIGLKYNLGMPRHKFELREMRLYHLMAIEKRKALSRALELMFSSHFSDVKKNYHLLLSAQDSLKSARNWLRISEENWDLGIGECDRLLDAYRKYYELRAIETENEFKYHVSLSKLGYYIGNTNKYIEWLENEKVSIE